MKQITKEASSIIDYQGNFVQRTSSKKHHPGIIILRAHKNILQTEYQNITNLTNTSNFRDRPECLMLRWSFVSYGFPKENVLHDVLEMFALTYNVSF